MTFNRFMINKEIIFDSNANELQSLKDETATVSLNAPTARCLKILLESKGKVISREEFLAEVWNARGVVVSQNTFYQNISLLRKSLEQAGLSKEIIVTVRQRGFVFASDIDVSLCSNTEENTDGYVLKEQLNSLSVENEAGNKEQDLPVHENSYPKKENVLNVFSWPLFLLIVMISVDIILLFINVIF